jgi:hypothetical protein
MNKAKRVRACWGGDRWASLRKKENVRKCIKKKQQCAKKKVVIVVVE